MGTNYYWHLGEARVYPTCAHVTPAKELHIGKSSFGWVFSVRLHPDENINSLEDWKERWNTPGSFILDEYDSTISKEEMLSTIVDRAKNYADRKDDRSYYGYNSFAHLLVANHATLHPSGLLCADVNSLVHKTFGTKRGEGTWDYHFGEFS